MRVSTTLVALLFLAAPARAQVENCFDCVLGLYDDLDLTSCSGTIESGVAKDIYLGIRYDPASGFDRLGGIEFSISGLDSGILLADWTQIPPTVVIDGFPGAPADTSAASTEEGGMLIYWPQCLSGSRAIARFTLLAIDSIVDRVLQVKRKYPTSNPLWHTPVFTRCDAPTYTAVRVTGGSARVRLMIWRGTWREH